ncbi:response regulator transcription factor [Metabacillus halosaccharovorans]|uniref:response regulator transcription factor n=1 Tax=Metabacillus halosaccharovorans TaxID=930124 RepID=UPI00203E0003|nr:response regulator [Metabacillus halosaccharovorans]MCM3443667.1 response regulator [Metabacillus halosaccharovorans]
MYSVLIVDDEPWVAYGISKLINWENVGFKVIGEVFDGLTALEKIKEESPDVVISDIRMPGLDGLKLLEEIKSLKLNTKVILVSGYSEFEYAQRAIRLAASDYLLKQINKDKLIDSLVKIKKELESREKVESFNNDLYHMLEGKQSATVADFYKVKGIESKHPYFQIINCHYEDHIMLDLFKEIQISDEIHAIGFKTGQNKNTFMINYEGDNVQETLNDFIDTHLSGAKMIGVSGIGTYSSSISSLYDEADIALCSEIFRPNKRIVYFQSGIMESQFNSLLFEIELALKARKQETITDLLDQLYEECKVNDLLIDQITHLYNRLISVLFKYYSRSDKMKDMDYLNFIQLTSHFRSVEKMFSWFKEMFYLHLDEEKIEPSNEQIKEVLAYIDDHFSTEIQLSTLAKKFNLSISYISTLVKKETGKTYSEYILEKRLNLAKNLLANQSLSIQEIVHQVGYKDYFHFNKLFKHNFGISPSKYRKL